MIKKENLQIFPESRNLQYPGLSLRDYIAVNAMKELIKFLENASSYEELAHDAYLLADAMLEARKK